MPDIDAAALEAARAADRALVAAKALGSERWTRYLEAMPDRLRDESLGELRRIARRARSAFGPQDSIRDVLPPDATEPLLESIDRLIKAIARHDMHR